MKMLTAIALAALACLFTVGGCETEPTRPTAQSDQEHLRDQGEAYVQRFRQLNANIAQSLDNAYAYAIFPEITKGAAGVGGAYGRGVVFEQGRFIGYTSVRQASIGAQLGGQKFAQLVLFEDKATLEHFKEGNLEFDARASAVAADKASSSTASYENGVAVYTMSRSGLMFEAAVGGQKFEYTPA